MSEQRIIFPYVQLTEVPTGKPLYILADLIGTMIVRDATGTTHDGEKKDFMLTEIFSPYGQSLKVIETPHQIADAITTSVNNAIKGTQQSMQNSLIMTPGLSLK